MSWKKRRRIDLAVTVALLIAATLLIDIFHLKFAIGTAIFFLFPALYLTASKPKSLKRILAATFGGLVFGFCFDLLGTINNTWVIPTSTLIIPYRIFGVVPVDDLLWFVCWIFFVLTTYEHFLEHDKTKKVSPHFKDGFAASLIILMGITFIFFLSPDALRIQYAYFFLILCALPVFLLFIIKHTFLWVKFIKMNVFLFFIFLTFELEGLKNNYWYFPGKYIGSVSLFGLTFPMEEFIFFMVLSTSIILSFYELYVDDEK